MVAQVPAGVLTLTMHPQVIGRGHRMAPLVRGGGRFARLGDVARELSAQNFSMEH